MDHQVQLQIPHEEKKKQELPQKKLESPLNNHDVNEPIQIST